MYNKKKPGTWCGMLESRKGNAVVVWDSVLPNAGTGKVFLFNTDRNALIEYVEEIVQPKLRELSGQEKKEFKNTHDKFWQQVREQYVVTNEEDENADGGSNSGGDLTDELIDLDDDGLEIDEDLDEV